ncbi:hypothetical protein F8388_013802 [Cannabis sativa]|uniref:Ubiquitin-like protease family profile domain-containing protein n=1 Tax=Cannabis sativa TaxID=3483 RepID=A0A7J6E6L4_CANSA|nr:hypothetical protein F8388_013802 [Cannabis sativa]
MSRSQSSYLGLKIYLIHSRLVSIFNNLLERRLERKRPLDPSTVSEGQAGSTGGGSVGEYDGDKLGSEGVEEGEKLIQGGTFRASGDQAEHYMDRRRREDHIGVLAMGLKEVLGEAQSDVGLVAYGIFLISSLFSITYCTTYYLHGADGLAINSSIECTVDIELPKADVVSQKHGCKKVSKKDTNVLPSASDDDFETEKIVAKPVSTKKRKVVSDDASASKKRKSKNVGEQHSNLDKVCEPRIVDDPKVVNVAKKGKKKPVSKSLGKKKSEAPSVDIPLFLEYYFKIDVKKRFAGKPQLYNPYNVIDDINENLSDEQKELFRKSPFGHFLDVSNFNYQIQLIHLVLLRQIHTERDDVELWFKLGDKAVRFGVEEFSTITGLDCTKSYDVDLFKSKKLLAYKEAIFCMHGLTEKLTVKEVASVFFSGALKDDEDYVKIALVYFFAGYLYGYPQGKKIDNFIFAMVNGDDYIEVFNRFGWGKLLWEKTFHHLKIALKDGNNTFEQLAKKKMIEKGYKLKGFPIAFLIWLYEIIPSLSPRFCNRVSNKIPRVLNWENSPTTEFSELIQAVFNNPKIVVKDFVASSGEKSERLFSKFKFDPKYVPKRIGGSVSSNEVNDDVKVSHGKLDQICAEITSIKECQQQIKDGISSLRIEFLSEFAKLTEIIKGLKKKENDGTSKDSEFFSSPIREVSVLKNAYYQDITDDGGALQLSVHSVQAEEEKETLNFENMFIDPDFLKGVVDSTVKSALKTDDVSFDDDSDKLSLVLYDESYLSPEVQKRQPKPSSVVLSPYVVDFGSSSSSKEDLMRIVEDDKFIVHGINPFKDEIGFNTSAEQCIKFSKFIDENIVMNRGVKKYSDADNILYPPMDFSFIEISEKMWFYELHACGVFLRDSHKHWILVHFDIKERMLNIYNSMSGAVNKKRALDHVKAYSSMLPFYLEYLDVYSSRPDLNLDQGPYSVGKREPLNFKFIDGLPSQVNSDCGVFVIKFAEFFIRGKIHDIPANMSDLVAVYRDDIAVSLFIHAKRKQIGGYITDDEVMKKGKKSKDKANVKGKDIPKGKRKAK